MNEQILHPPRQTVLHDWHEKAGAKMVEFGGWRMPVQYPSGIIREHLATRRQAALFDISHMGRFRVTGGGAEALLLRVLTNNVRALAPGLAQYTIIANETGTVYLSKWTSAFRSGRSRRQARQMPEM